MASKDEKQVPMELEGPGAGGDGDDAELVLAMVTSPSLSSSDAGAILLGTGATTVPDDESISGELVDPRAVRRHNDPMDLVELAHTVQQADKFLRATTGGKLQVIVDQIRFLQQQAHGILATAKRDSQLHHAACNFTKVPGTIYHLYERSNGTPYFSMLSPREWGGACPHKFLGSYRLEHDHSWTPYDKIEARDKDIKAIDRAIIARPARRT